MDNRLLLFWQELQPYYCEQNSKEFTYTIENWGVMWNPWFLYVNDKSISTSANDISTVDLNLSISFNPHL